MEGIHNTQTKEKLISRLEALAMRLGCHADLIYSRAVDMQNAIAKLDPNHKMLENERK